MDLHDGVIQSIYAVGLTLESTRLVMQNDPADAEVLVDHAINALNDTISRYSQLYSGFTPSSF